MDLVEVAPNAVPPVCRLMDYGKFRYQEQKKAQEAKAKQKVVQIKEVKFRPATDENDFQTKLRSLKRFLEDGDKVKITLRFRGREMAHQQFGTQLMDRVREELVDIAQVAACQRLDQARPRYEASYPFPPHDEEQASSARYGHGA